MMMLLKDILFNTGVQKMHGSSDVECTSLTADSKAVTPGAVFVAVKGTRADGHAFIQDAIDKGAVAIILTNLPEERKEGISYALVKDSAHALGEAAANFYGRPSEKMRIIGVTGTNGKTTIATLLHRLYSGLGHQAGLFSTVCNMVGEEVLPSTHTTPDPVKLQALMAGMVSRGCTYCFMEVSSHAVVQERISGIRFTGAVFTNLTHDHLDYHGTFDHYLTAKKKFFDRLPETAFALVNLDDRNGTVMVQSTRARVQTYSLTQMAGWRCRILENSLTGLHLQIDGAGVWFRLIGSFNAYNLLAVYAAACIEGQEKEEVLRVLSGLAAPEGRFDTITGPDGKSAVVDYAHTPDALKNILGTLRDVRGGGKIITVAGAGGDRDPAKRPLMARIACELSDQVILTSDNPRSEDPETILDQMMQGVDAVNRKKVLRITSREEAIHTACTLAASGDIILVAGKGHEKYQEIKGVKHPFDDKEMLKKYLYD